VRVASFPWFKEEELAPVLPVLHGTDASVAWKIAGTGFSALSSLDAGWYGKGMYFSSSAMYTLPYYGSKARPALLLCFSVPGNPYPVVESRMEKETLLGQPIYSGYQSNYVLTNKDGVPCSKVQDDYYDEIILDQESQVVPFALVEFEKAGLKPLLQDFAREVSTPNETKKSVIEEQK